MSNSESGDAAGPLWRGAVDPAANIRALGDVQRRALDAAAAVVDRLVQSVDGGRPAGDADPEAGPPPAGISELQRLAQTWTEAMVGSVQALATMTGAMSGGRQDGPSPGARIDVDAPGRAGEVAIAVAAGDEATTEVWIHNGTSEDQGPLRLHVGELRSSNGSTLAPDVVVLDPSEIEGLPPRSSRGVRLKVMVPTGTTPERHLGVLLVEGLPGVWLPVHVEVTAP